MSSLRILSATLLALLLRTASTAAAFTTTNLHSQRSKSLSFGGFQRHINVKNTVQYSRDLSLAVKEDERDHKDQENSHRHLDDDLHTHLRQQQSEHQQLPHDQTKNITAAVQRKIRVAEAQAKIDRLLSGPDAPFDLEGEMKRVASIAPPVPSSGNSLLDQELELKEQQLEQELYQAVQQKDYAKAATVKQEISQMHIDDCGAVLQANSKFYRAFSDNDYESMQQLWLQDGTAVCIHPSCKPIVGTAAVLESWNRMFKSSSRRLQKSWMEPHKIRLSVKGASTAVVTCDEHVYTRRFIRGQKRQTELVNKLTATNIFRKVPGSNGQPRWLLTHHHSSWHVDSPASKMALKATSRSNSKSSSRRSASRGKEEESVDADDDLGSILGVDNVGPWIGPSSKEGQSKPSSLENLVNMLNNIDQDNSDLDESIGSSGFILPNGMGNIKRIVIRPSDGVSENILETSIDEEDDDDDDDVEEEEEDDDDDAEIISINRQDNGDSATDITEWTNQETSSRRRDTSEKTSNNSANNNDILRQECISSLRRLCDRGSISPKQKRVLLTDIIQRSAKGKFSMVEVAYELLCGEAGETTPEDVAEEEFADQCRVLASSLLEDADDF